VGKVSASALLNLYGLFVVVGLPRPMRLQLLSAGVRITVAALVCAAAAYCTSVLIPRPDAVVSALARICLIGITGLLAYGVALPFAAPAVWTQLRFTLKRATQNRSVLARLLPTAMQKA
jgi:hypothetical protein